MVEKVTKCNDCDQVTPETNTNFSLIELGWRLHRAPLADGSYRFEFRCPACWLRFKAKTKPAG